MAQKIKYQDTTVDPMASAAQIAALISRYGARSFGQHYAEDGSLSGVHFVLRVQDAGDLPVMLRAPSQTIEAILWGGKIPAPAASWDKAGQAKRIKVHEQALRIAWRHLKDYIEQSLLAVQTGLFPVGAAFMAHMEGWDSESGQTRPFYEIAAARLRLSGNGRGVVLLPASSLGDAS